MLYSRPWLEFRRAQISATFRFLHRAFRRLSPAARDIAVEFSYYTTDKGALIIALEKYENEIKRPIIDHHRPPYPFPSLRLRARAACPEASRRPFNNTARETLDREVEDNRRGTVDTEHTCRPGDPAKGYY